MDAEVAFAQPFKQARIGSAVEQHYRPLTHQPGRHRRSSAACRSEWSEEEQRELLDFPRALRETKAKILLTSRRDERAWLGDLPSRVEVSPMPMRERLQLAGAIAGRHGKRLAGLPDLRPLLAYTGGNPLTLLVTVRQALRDGVAADEALAAYVARLRAGEAAFTDEQVEGRTKSLGASLSYGFTHGFTEDERKILALLHLFRRFSICSSPSVPGIRRRRCAVLDGRAGGGLVRRGSSFASRESGMTREEARFDMVFLASFQDQL
jgi:hypothetical protein